MSEEDLVFIDMWATCATAGCPSLGIVVNVHPPEDGEVACGVCGNTVTDITDIKPTEGTVLPQWILDQLAMQNSTN